MNYISIRTKRKLLVGFKEKERKKMNKDFKVGDRVKVVGCPYIKDGTLATVIILGDDYCGIRFDDYGFKVKFGTDDTDYFIGVGKKYLEKAEDWLHFETTNINSKPLISTIVKLEKEVRLYNSMYQWKEKFDPEEPDWENNKEDKWYISRYSNGAWWLSRTFSSVENLQVYFTTVEKAEQCLEWLKKEGVLY